MNTQPTETHHPSLIRSAWRQPDDFCRVVHGIILALITVALPAAKAAPTIWTGPVTNYTQQVPYDPTQTPPYTDRDVLTANVALTRANPSGGGSQTGGLFNAVDESSFNKSAGGPADTEWADGTLSNALSLSYTTWINASGGMPVFDIVGKQLVAHLITDDVYLSVVFTSFPSGPGFAYNRSTPAVTTPTVTVSITNPASGAVFAAPANVKIGAAAAVSSGTVTNVSFFANSNLLGSVPAAPFRFTASNLTAGAYSLAAIATAAGISATSSVVNISVVTPVAISNATPGISNGQFSFTYTANPGLTYLVQNSSNLSNWLPVVTNVATNNLIRFTSGLVSNGSRFYRVARLPNP